jgi:hypothetical protein
LSHREGAPLGGARSRRPPSPREVLGRWGLLSGYSGARRGDELVNWLVNQSRRVRTCGVTRNRLSMRSVAPSNAQIGFGHALHAGGRRFESCTAHREKPRKTGLSVSRATARAGRARLVRNRQDPAAAACQHVHVGAGTRRRSRHGASATSRGLVQGLSWRHGSPPPSGSTRTLGTGSWLDILRSTPTRAPLRAR